MLTLSAGGMFLCMAMTGSDGGPGSPLPPLLTASTRNRYSYSSSRFSQRPLKQYLTYFYVPPRFEKNSQLRPQKGYLIKKTDRILTKARFLQNRGHIFFLYKQLISFAFTREKSFWDIARAFWGHCLGGLANLMGHIWSCRCTIR